MSQVFSPSCCSEVLQPNFLLYPYMQTFFFLERLDMDKTCPSLAVRSRSSFSPNAENIVSVEERKKSLLWSHTFFQVATSARSTSNKLLVGTSEKNASPGPASSQVLPCSRAETPPLPTATHTEGNSAFRNGQIS